MSLLTLLIIILVVSALFGGFGSVRNWGYYGWSPFGLILIILLLLWATGQLR